MVERRQKKLVVGHLENVSGDVFDQYPAVIRDMIKDRSGVYALYRMVGFFGISSAEQNGFHYERLGVEALSPRISVVRFLVVCTNENSAST